MRDSARYVKIVESSQEDRRRVVRNVEEAIELYRREGRPLPPPTSGRDFANKMQDVA
jgi:hypothetical protein